MTDFVIAGKRRRNIEGLPVRELNRLLELARQETKNYIKYARSGKPALFDLHVDSLSQREAKLQQLIEQRN